MNAARASNADRHAAALDEIADVIRPFEGADYTHFAWQSRFSPFC